jgi:hypothetical protein
MTSIEFSAQFGGTDAASHLLPHFKALKAAESEIVLNRFPYPKLAFVLRVDGEVHRFGFSGPGHPEVDRKRRYLSVDIGIEGAARVRLPDCICELLLSSARVIEAAAQRDSRTVDVPELEHALTTLCARYRERLQ